MSRLSNLLQNTLLISFILCESTALYFSDYTTHTTAYVVCGLAEVATLYWLYLINISDKKKETYEIVKISLGKKIYLGLMIFQGLMNFLLFGMGMYPIQQTPFLSQAINSFMFICFIGGIYTSSYRKNGSLMLISGFVLAEGVSMLFWALISLSNNLH